MNKTETKELKNYGGQALIEGILMRGKRFVVAAFRLPDQSIRIETEELSGLYKSKIGGIPFLRGLVILWDSLYLGMKFLALSANFQTEEDEKIEGPAMFLALSSAILIAIGFFFILPLLFRELLNKLIPLSPLLLNILEGAFRLLLLIGYVWIIGKNKDISRVFAYHGAEHKTINAFEDGEEITVDNIMRFPLTHPRCGTSFLLTLVIVSILFFSILGDMSLLFRFFTRILAIPFLAMLSYEIIRILGKFQDNLFVKLITYPNLLLQSLTTREPDSDMIEVALASFDELLKLEQ